MHSWATPVPFRQKRIVTANVVVGDWDSPDSKCQSFVPTTTGRTPTRSRLTRPGEAQVNASAGPTHFRNARAPWGHSTVTRTPTPASGPKFSAESPHRPGPPAVNFESAEPEASGRAAALTGTGTWARALLPTAEVPHYASESVSTEHGGPRARGSGRQPMSDAAAAAADTASARSLWPGVCATRSHNRPDSPRAWPCGPGVLQRARLGCERKENGLARGSGRTHGSNAKGACRRSAA